MVEESECRHCGEPDETICERCGQVVCFGCFDSDLCLCVECAVEAEDD